MVEVFNLIYNLKDVKEEKLILNDDDEFTLRFFYDDCNMKKICKFKLWKKIVIDFSVDSLMDVPRACLILSEKIIEKYGKHK